MSGGTIYGVDAPAGYPNKVSGSGADGAAVYVNSGTAKYDGAYAGKGYGSGDDGNAIVTTNNTVPFIKSATVPVTGVTLNKTTASLTVGGTETLTATVTPTNATNKTVTWSTSTPAVATVSNGVVTAVAAGTATITVTTVDGGKTATCAVTVTQPSTPPEEITSGKGIVLVKIPAGIFTMGSPTTEPDRSTDETQHPVTLTKSFYMGKYPVTQEQYQAVMGTNPSYFTTMVSGESGTPGKLPVEGVSWYDALVFCNTLSIMEGLSPVYSISDKTNPADWGTVPTSSPAVWDAVVMVSGANGYRLPTEAEWEYVCRAGTTTAYNTGATISDNTGWYDYNSSSKTHQVGLKPANAWGLYDMHGNVFEWCWDWLGSYSNGAQTDPQGAVTGTNRVGRGGSWGNYGRDLRSALRGDDTPSGRGDYLGFRLVRSVP
ncbi:MAG: SUMF1/EgtB/PvdO family nonheme iron enzyme [Treponema sp.]|nr:SUMF1/EgtB/PvdO family nonheme iron enzyme [Treponema sp.]